MLCNNFIIAHNLTVLFLLEIYIISSSSVFIKCMFDHVPPYLKSVASSP